VSGGEALPAAGAAAGPMLDSRAGPQPAYLVAGLRTPFAAGGFAPDPGRLAEPLVPLAQRLLLGCNLDPAQIGACHLGTAAAVADNPGAELALRAGTGAGACARTLAAGPLAGIAALAAGARSIALGAAELVLVAAVEPPPGEALALTAAGVRWHQRWQRRRAWLERARLLARARPGRLAAPLPGPLVREADGAHAGRNAEALAAELAIGREDCDALAAASRERYRRAEAAGRLTERVSARAAGGGLLGADHDDPGESGDPDAPLYDARYGLLNAANSGRLVAGGCVCLLASAAALERFSLPALACLSASAPGAGPGERAGLAMAAACSALLARQGLAASAVDFWELDEFLATPWLASVAAIEAPAQAAGVFEPAPAATELDRARINTDGGTLAIGHAPAATGLRLVLHLARVLERERAGRGIAAMADGFGGGSAVLLEAP